MIHSKKAITAGAMRESRNLPTAVSFRGARLRGEESLALPTMQPAAREIPRPARNDTCGQISKQTKRRLAVANPLLIVSLVLSGFFALWLTNLGSPSLSSDESFIAILTAQPAGEILQRLNSDEPHPSAYYLAMHA
jgi:hypothetical protein